MNVSEVYMLSRNLWWFYRKFSYPTLFTQIGDHAWFYHEREITEISPYTPQQLSKVLFYWVFE